MKSKLLYQQGNNVAFKDFEGNNISLDLKVGTYTVIVDDIFKIAISERVFISYEIL